MLWPTVPGPASLTRVISTMSPSFAVMSGPGKDYTVEFWLHEGSEVQIEETRPDWLRVSLGAKLRGWIRAASVVRI